MDKKLFVVSFLVEGVQADDQGANEGKGDDGDDGKGDDGKLDDPSGPEDDGALPPGSEPSLTKDKTPNAKPSSNNRGYKTVHYHSCLR